MDFSDHLRRKIGKAVYANYYQQETINAYTCISDPSSSVCVSDIKPKSFADAYNIAAGSSQGGCGYTINKNGSFSYVPKCPPTEYSNASR